MKKLLYLLLFITGTAFAQSPPDSTQVTPGQSFTPQFRFLGQYAADGVNQFRNPLNNKWFSLYSTFQSDRRFAQKDSTFNINKNLFDVMNKVAARRNLGVPSMDSLAKYGVDVTMFGFKADSSLASKITNSDALTAAANYAAANKLGAIVLPSGHAFLDRNLGLPANVSIIGKGSGLSTLDFRFGDTTQFVNGASIYAMGTQKYLGNLSVIAKYGFNKITLNTNVSMKQGDIIQIRDTTSFSFNFARAAYREGEMAVVRLATTNNPIISLEYALSGNYPTVSSAEVWLQNQTQTNIKGLTVIAYNTPSSSGVVLDRIKDSRLEDVIVLNAGARNIYILNSFNTELKNVRSYQFSSVTSVPITSYGMVVVSSHLFSVLGGEYFGYRHGIVSGGGGGGGLTAGTSTPVRFSTFSGVKTSSFDKPGFNLHGSNQFTNIVNNDMLTGAQIGGKDVTFALNRVNADNKGAKDAATGIPLEFSEPNGNNFKITNNTFYGRYYGSNSVGIQYYPETGIDTVGVFDFSDNTYEYDLANSGSDTHIIYAMDIHPATGSGHMPLRFNITNNNVYAVNNRREVRLSISGNDTTRMFKEVVWKNNNLVGVSIWSKANMMHYIEDNKISELKWYGIQTANGELVLKNNHVKNYALTSATGAPSGYHSAFRLAQHKVLFRNGNTATTTATPTMGSYLLNIVSLITGLNDVQGGDTFSNTGGVVTTQRSMAMQGVPANTFLFNDANQRPTGVGFTGTGNVVRATSPTLVTPALGTPASGIITNLTGTCATCNVGGNAGTVTNGVYTSTLNGLGDARWGQLGANNLWAGDNSYNNKTIKVYATGTVADGMGGVHVTMANDGKIKGAFGITSYLGTALAMGMNTATNDYVIGAGAARDINAEIDHVSYRHNPSSGSFTYYDVSDNPILDVSNTGVATANSFVKSGGTSSEFLMADGSVSSGSTSITSNSVSAQTTAQTILTYSVGVADKVFNVSGFATISSASTLVFNLNVSYTTEDNNAASYNIIAGAFANGQYGGQVTTIKAKAGTDIVISTNLTGSCTYNAGAYVTPLF